MPATAVSCSSDAPDAAGTAMPPPTASVAARQDASAFLHNLFISQKPVPSRSLPSCLQVQKHNIS